MMYKVGAGHEALSDFAPRAVSARLGAGAPLGPDAPEGRWWLTLKETIRWAWDNKWFVGNNFQLTATIFAMIDVEDVVGLSRGILCWISLVYVDVDPSGVSISLARAAVWRDGDMGQKGDLKWYFVS